MRERERGGGGGGRKFNKLVDSHLMLYMEYTGYIGIIMLLLFACM